MRKGERHGLVGEDAALASSPTPFAAGGGRGKRTPALVAPSYRLLPGAKTLGE
jgi:hypothetical protein